MLSQGINQSFYAFNNAMEADETSCAFKAQNEYAIEIGGVHDRRRSNR